MQSQIPFFWLHRMDMEWNVQNVVENILMSILMSALLLKATFHFQRTTPVTFTLEKLLYVNRNSNCFHTYLILTPEVGQESILLLNVYYICVVQFQGYRSIILGSSSLFILGFILRVLFCCVFNFIF